MEVPSRRLLIRRQAERRFRRAGRPEHYWEAQRLHEAMRRALQKLSSKSWKSLSGTLTPLTPAPKVWYNVRTFQSWVVQAQSFRALAVSRGVSAVVLADEVCVMLAQPSDFMSSAEYTMSIAEAYHAYGENKCLSDF